MLRNLVPSGASGGRLVYNARAVTAAVATHSPTRSLSSLSSTMVPRTTAARVSPLIPSPCKRTKGGGFATDSTTTTTNMPELTKDVYNVPRGNYAKLNDTHVKFFTQLLGETRVLSDPTEIQGYNVDWVKNVRGYSSLVLKPRTTEEVSKILEYCNKERLAVCPQAGNTGLVGGSVPVHDEIILSTSLMNQIIHFDENSGVLVCQAGCVLEALNTFVEEKGFIMPLDLGAKGSCQIGGNVSTNAGGLRLLRYGNLHGSVLGVEAVLADGTVIDCLSTLKKDNTGYHLKHLFIGSEGTLGIVTKVAVNCPTKPRAINIAFLAVDSFERVLETFKMAKQHLGEVLSSCELIDNMSLEVVRTYLQVRNPLPDHFPFYMLIETSGSNVIHDEEKLNNFLEKCMENKVIIDGTVTNEPGKMDQIWQLRERIAEGFMREGYVLKYDISLPLKNFYTIVPDLRERLGKDAMRVTGYGHIGDGNLHLNIQLKQFSREMLHRIEPYVFEYISKLKGSVSAEHGIGFKKTKFIHYSKSPSAINLMQQLKHLMDPNRILNPYKVLPDSKLK